MVGASTKSVVLLDPLLFCPPTLRHWSPRRDSSTGTLVLDTLVSSFVPFLPVSQSFATHVSGTPPRHRPGENLADTHFGVLVPIGNTFASRVSSTSVLHLWGDGRRGSVATEGTVPGVSGPPHRHVDTSTDTRVPRPVPFAEGNSQGTASSSGL